MSENSHLLVDINEATVDVLDTLTGVGRTKAEAIVTARKNATDGKFTSVNDLLTVSGIGPAIIEQNRSILVCNSTLSRRETRSVTAARAAARRKPTSSTATNNSMSSTATNSSMSSTATFTVKRDTPVTECQVAECRTSNCPVIDDRPLKLLPEIGSIDVVDSRHCVVDPVACSSTNVTHWTRQSAATNTESLRTSIDIKTPHHVRQSLLPLFTGLSVIQQPTSAAAAAAAAAAGDGGGSDDGDAVSSVSTAAEDDNCSLRSRIPVSNEAVEKHWMKRKAEDKKMHSTLKKPCNDVDCSDAICNDKDDDHCVNQRPVAAAACATVISSSTTSRKQRIPSRNNPPPMLSSWLQTFQDWDHAERLLALDELMELCNPTQVRHVMQVIEPQFQRDFISLLPKELALYVLTFLEPRDLARASQTCHYWHILTEDNLLWREKCSEEGLSESMVWPQRAKRRRIPHSSVNLNVKTHWKSVYKRQRLIENNWFRMPLKPPKVLKGHDDHVITCLEFCGNKIVSGSDDNTLKVWSALTGKVVRNHQLGEVGSDTPPLNAKLPECLRTLVGHTGGVWSSQMLGNTVISGSTDRTLKVWNAETGQCTFTLYGHTSTVRCMHLHGTKLVSGSRDATLRVWDIESGLCLHVLIGHVAAVRCVQYDGRKVVSGAYDYMVKIWDPEHETCLQTLSGHTNRVYSLQFDGVHIVSGSLDTSIRVWNAENGTCLHTLIGHQSLTSGMELKDDILVSGNADSTVKIWNITTGQCLQTLQGANKHQSAVTCLQFTRRFVVTSSDDGTVKIWDLRTGEFLRNLVALESGGSGGVVWRIRCSNTKLVCAVGSRNGTEETKLLVLDFDVDDDVIICNGVHNVLSN